MLVALSSFATASTVRYAVKNGQMVIQPSGTSCCNAILSNNNAVEDFTYHAPPASVLPYQRILTPTSPCCTIPNDQSTVYYTEHVQPTPISYVASTPANVNNYYMTYYGSNYGDRYRNYRYDNYDSYNYNYYSNTRNRNMFTYTRSMNSRTSIHW